MAAELTGRKRYRAGWFGRVVLQVEIRETRTTYHAGLVDTVYVHYWRDATVSDLPVHDDP